MLARNDPSSRTRASRAARTTAIATPSATRASTPTSACTSIRSDRTSLRRAQPQAGRVAYPRTPSRRIAKNRSARASVSAPGRIRVRPVGRREDEQHRGLHVEVGAQRAALGRLTEDIRPPLLVAPALGAKRGALGSSRKRHSRVNTVAASTWAATTARCARSASRTRSSGAVSLSGTPSSAAWNAAPPSRVTATSRSILRVGERVERPLLDTHRLGEVGHRRPVVPPLCEESRGDVDELVAAGARDHVDDATGRSVASEAWTTAPPSSSPVQSGGLVETGDWMPDEYRKRLTKFVEMHANSELMGVLPERDWILRAPRCSKLALTAKIQDEVGHAQLLYRVVEDLGKPREACFDDLIAGKSKFHNVFHYPTRTWGDVGVIAWLVDAAAIISQKALLKCSYAPYARIIRKICWEVVPHPPRPRRDPHSGHRDRRTARARPEALDHGGSRS